MQLHVFPEGRISYNGKVADLRWGIGKMVCDVMKHSGGKCASCAADMMVSLFISCLLYTSDAADE